MTELTWEGKYKDGKKVTPVRIALPFQTIETVNESAEDRKRTIDMFAQQANQNSEWRNRLIWGDKKYVLPSLLPEFAGKVNLIYIDPPFNVGSDFSFTATIADHPDTEYDETTQFVKEPSIIEQKAYRDTWGKGLDSYMQWFYETALLLKELLAEDGSIYVHLDWHVGHYAKAILDEVLGYENFRNEIIWYYPGRERVSENKFQSKHDLIYFYGKSHKSKLNPIRKEWNRKERIKAMRRKIHKGKDGKEWFWETRGQAHGVKSYKRSLDEYLDKGGALNDVWDDIQFLRGNHPERVSYETQKPEELLSRIISASSSEGDLILDSFCGSGTTAAVAEKLNRRWITCDLGRFAIHTTRKRLLGIEGVKPFIVQNLGKYERQQWMIKECLNYDASDEKKTTKVSEKETNEDLAQRMQIERNYKHFICDLYHAKPLDGYTWLHGAKAGRMIHVGSVDAPVTVEDIKAAIKEFWKLVGKEKSAKTNGIDFLGWDFAFDVNETARQFAAENKVDISFKKIPREVLEKKAVEQGDIKFYELASLGIKTKKTKKNISLTLDNFIIPPDDVPVDVQGKITHWSQWIDYWAVDWNYRDDTFHNEWQSYRTKQKSNIELSASKEYEEPGKYTVLVKVIDILGNDTTKAINVEL